MEEEEEALEGEGEGTGAMGGGGRENESIGGEGRGNDARGCRGGMSTGGEMQKSLKAQERKKIGTDSGSKKIKDRRIEIKQKYSRQ